MPLHLDHGLIGRRSASEASRQADHSFVTDGRYLDRIAVFHDGHGRDDASAGEVHVVDGGVGFVEDLLEVEGYGIQMDRKPLVLALWQTSQQTVFALCR